MKTLQKSAIAKIIQHGIDNLVNVNPDGTYGCDLHNKLYNEDYFIIGTWEAKQFLNEYGTFEAIEVVKDYEKDNFGEVSTDLSNPEKVANMLAYILGEQALSECKTLNDNWDNRLTAEQLEAIQTELTEML